MAAGKDMNYGALLALYGTILTERQQTIMEAYYWEDLSLGEIAENTGITRQAVRDGIKNGEKRLLKLEEELGLSEKVRKCNEFFEEISAIAENINDCPQAEEIHRLALAGTEIF